MVDVVQLVRKFDCELEGHEFKSHHSPKIINKMTKEKRIDTMKFGEEYIYVVSERTDLSNYLYFLDYDLAIRFESDKEKYTFWRKKIKLNKINLNKIK